VGRWNRRLQALSGSALIAFEAGNIGDAMTGDTPANPLSLSPLRSPLLSLPASVESVGLGVAASYGNPFTEQRDLLRGSALVDLSHHGVISVTGPDRLTWLDSLLSQELRSLQSGQSTEALLLDPHGHIEHAIRILDDGVVAWLLVDEDRSASLAKWLDRMRFMKQVEVADVSATIATFGAFDSDSSSTLASTLATTSTPASAISDDSASSVLEAVAFAPEGQPLIWSDPWNHVSTGGWQYADAAEHPASQWNYREVLVSRDRIPELIQKMASARVAPAGLIALEALRIAAWRPRITNEGDATALPHETDWLRSAVHLSKGCYRGQETVAKVHNLGHPPRRLVFLTLDGSDAVLPEQGTPVFFGEVEVGRITSSGRHFEEGAVALAVIKRSVAPDAELVVHVDSVEVAAAQIVIVPTDAGRVANVPRMPRLGKVTRPV
jgi:folate-binding protein YgfZ